MTRAKVVVTDHAFVDVEYERAVAERSGAAFEVHACVTPAETVDAVRGADVAFVNFAPMGEEQLAAMAPGATVIRYGVGVDNVDLDAASRHGVAVANVPDYGVDTVADHATAMLLALLRRIPVYDRGIRERGWVRPADVGEVRSFGDTTIGLLGAGRIARAVADRLRSFGFRVIAYDPYLPAETAAAHGIELLPLDDVVAQANGLSLHLPATAGTHRMVDDALLASLPEGAVLVNTSRGALVDEGAVARALESGRLAGAGLDVFDPEPLADDSPLRSEPGAVFSPHAAFYSVTSLDNLQRLAAEEAARALRGEPLRCAVTPIASEEDA